MSPLELYLSSPRCPGGKGDDNRWVLHVREAGGGMRVPLYGPRADETEKAMAQAAAELGYAPEWAPIEPKFPNWPPAWRACPPEIDVYQPKGSN